MKMFDFLLGSATVVNVSAADALIMKMVDFLCGGLVYNVYRLRDLDKIDHSGNREYVDDRIMRAIERMMQRKLDTATPIDMVGAADLLNVVNEVLKNE